MGDLATFLGVNNGETGEVADPAKDEEEAVGEEQSETDEKALPDGEAGEEEKRAESTVELAKTNRQPPEVDAAFARARRAEEEVARRDAWVEQYFGHQGIHTWDEYVQAVAREQAHRQEEAEKQSLAELQEQGYDPEALWKVFEASPRIRELRETVTSLKNYVDGLATEKQRSEQENTARQSLAAEFEELKAEYPEFTSIDDLGAKMPPESFGKLCEKVKQGYTLIDAYESVNKASIRAKTTAAARQAALNAVNSKQHLRPDGGGADDLDITTVPPEVVRNYKALCKGITDEQIVADYKKHNPRRRR